MEINEEYRKYLARMKELVEDGQADMSEVLNYEEYKREYERRIDNENSRAMRDAEEI